MLWCFSLLNIIFLALEESFLGIFFFLVAELAEWGLTLRVLYSIPNQALLSVQTKPPALYFLLFLFSLQTAFCIYFCLACSFSLGIGLRVVTDNYTAESILDSLEISSSDISPKLFSLTSGKRPFFLLAQSSPWLSSVLRTSAALCIELWLVSSHSFLGLNPPLSSLFLWSDFNFTCFATFARLFESLPCSAGAKEAWGRASSMSSLSLVFCREAAHVYRAYPVGMSALLI